LRIEEVEEMASTKIHSTTTNGKEQSTKYKESTLLHKNIKRKKKLKKNTTNFWPNHGPEHSEIGIIS
jgi:hypothetical protein